MSVAPRPGGTEEETEPQRRASAALLLEWLLCLYSLTGGLRGVCPLALPTRPVPAAVGCGGASPLPGGSRGTRGHKEVPRRAPS